MFTMTEPTEDRAELPTSEEWTAFQQNALEHRKDLERTLRRLLTHDRRTDGARASGVSARDVADEALTWALSEWRSKPSRTPPAQWMRKRAIQLLEEALDRETLDDEGRREELLEERRQRKLEHVVDDEERTRWRDLIGSRREPPVPFDGLAADDQVSRVESRLDETELLEQLDRELGNLPEIGRRVLVHRYLDDLGVDDIAYLLDLPVEDVQRELDGAVADLRRRLA